jgi:ubiquinone/menaquinone biosynthesis C-methylase UbiE
MATIAKNRRVWESYDWSKRGDEWSVDWGGPEAQWEGSIFPRIRKYLHGDVVEIAPGFGRWTEFLRQHCDSLVGIDLLEKCVEQCRQRFSEDSRLRFLANDGRSLPTIRDGSVDFVFSCDSLVHVEAETMKGYAAEIKRVLKPGGAAFIHHSNLESITFWDRLRAGTNGLPRRLHMRARSMSARVMNEFVKLNGMSCTRQELISWGNPLLIDCFTTIVNLPNLPGEIIRNSNFMKEAASIKSGRG